MMKIVKLVKHLFNCLQKTKNQTETNVKAGFLLSPMEKEVLYLNATMEFIDSLVNRDNFIFSENNGKTFVQFNTSKQLNYFSIVLVDFLSTSDKQITGDKKVSYLSALMKICDSPSFKKAPINDFSKAVTCFSDWISSEVTMKKVWLPSINKELDMKITRYEMFKICGNVTKHNITRLSYMRDLLRKVLIRNRIDIDDAEALSSLADFYEFFHEYLHGCYAGELCEILNNIRLGIFEYLMPEYKRAYIGLGADDSNNLPRKYSFNVPSEISNSFATHCYWALMDKMRRGSFIKKFTAYRVNCER